MQAVITLNQDALYPFTKETAHILLINKQAHDAVWFFQVQRDGYDSGRKRDLMQPPDIALDQNDIPFVQIAANMTGRERDLQQIVAPTCPIAYHFVQKNGGFIGCVIKTHRNTSITSITYIIDGPHTSLSIAINNSNSKYDIHFPDTQLQRAPHKGDVPFQHGIPDQLIAITPDGRLVGITIPIQRISSLKNDLLPKNYIQRHSPNSGFNRDNNPFSPAHPQEQLESAFIDESETMQLGQNTRQTVPAESELAAQQPFEIPQLVSITEPSQSLGKTQHIIWNTIKQCFSTETYAVPFTSAQLINAITEIKTETEIEAETETIVIPEIISALTLFERLGLIIRVTLPPDQNNTMKTYYRRITAGDIKQKTAATNQAIAQTNQTRETQA